MLMTILILQDSIVSCQFPPLLFLRTEKQLDTVVGVVAKNVLKEKLDALNNNNFI